MKAAVFHGPRDIRVEQVPDPGVSEYNRRQRRRNS